MRLVRLLFLGGITVGAIALAPGCLGATQMTLDIRAENAKCAELRGTAITIGVRPDATEKTVGFPNASTTACDDASGEIGTLVVTPSDAGRAAIVVVVAYGDTKDPTTCTPPLYKGCIVARRSFAFVDHEGLRMPITLSPDCLDVPCDAFSTCRHGQCFASDVTCNGGLCPEPGALDDGGTIADSGYVPETGPVPPTPPGPPPPPPIDGSTGDGASDASLDAPSDGPLLDGTIDGGGAYCDAQDVLVCNVTSCGGMACCLSNGGGPYCSGTCGADTRLCCTNADCGGLTCTRSKIINVNLNQNPIPVGGSAPGQCL